MHDVKSSPLDGAQRAQDDVAHRPSSIPEELSHLVKKLIHSLQAFRSHDHLLFTRDQGQLI